MNVQHFEKGLQYSDRDLLLLARKIGRLATYCKRLKDEASSIRVEAERRPTKKETDSVKVMITVDLPRKRLRAESRRDSALDAIDRCIEKLEPQIKRYKELGTGLGKLRAHASRRSA
ncbi:MAG: HPF/RaiA family ribosome-associated protein [Candidatus Peribacteraceae bacterium]|nr:HPF/RaiA family ribosome-associated protein [Candidatus Peribacteraceae bacterium]